MIAAEVAAKNLLAYEMVRCCVQMRWKRSRASRHGSMQQWLSCEVADMKKAFTTEELVMNFMEFTKRGDEVSASLALETQRLVRMHNAQIVELR